MKSSTNQYLGQRNNDEKNSNSCKLTGCKKDVSKFDHINSKEISVSLDQNLRKIHFCKWTAYNARSKNKRRAYRANNRKRKKCPIKRMVLIDHKSKKRSIKKQKVDKIKQEISFEKITQNKSSTYKCRKLGKKVDRLDGNVMYRKKVSWKRRKRKTNRISTNNKRRMGLTKSTNLRKLHKVKAFK